MSQRGQRDAPECLREIALDDFDDGAVVDVMSDGSLRLRLPVMPPTWASAGSFDDLQAQLEQATGTRVVGLDRELFALPSPAADSVARIQHFLRELRGRAGPLVELLGVPGCPGIPPTLQLIREVFGDVDVRNVVVDSEDAARGLRFLGSPSVRVDGVDIEEGADLRADFGVQCRVYVVGEKLLNVPPREWLERVRDLRPRPSGHG